MEPPLPLLPRPGRVRPRAASSPACSPPATPGRSRSRCSTTSSARPTPTAPRSTRMRSLIVLEELGLTAAPSRAALDGYAFVELGVDADSAPATEALLRTLGFGHVGPHRSKPVQLWQHGDIRIVAQPRRGRRRPRGRGRRRRERRTRRRSAERAEALLAPVLARRREPGRGRPRGGRRAGRHRRCSSAAPTRAGSTTSSRSARAGQRPRRRSTGIDHITLAQPFEAFDEAGLFYRSRARPARRAERRAGGARRARPQPRPGERRRPRPDRAQRPGAGRHRSAGRPSSSTSRSRATTRSPPRARCATAARRSCRSPRTTTTTSRPGYELDPELLDALRELDVLYDRSGAGELLHFYTALGGPGVLRGARAARRLRRLRGRQLTGAHGSPAGHAVGTTRRRDAAHAGRRS